MFVHFVTVPKTLLSVTSFCKQKLFNLSTEKNKNCSDIVVSKYGNTYSMSDQ